MNKKRIPTLGQAIPPRRVLAGRYGQANIFMRKISISLILFSFGISIYAQQTQQWINQLENPKYDSDLLNPTNEIETYKAFDFSTFLVPKTDFLGFIGDDYRRIRIFYSSIGKDSYEPIKYNVTGISLVGSNKCTFQGTITLTQVRELQTMHFGLDNEYNSRGLKSQFVVVADYEFNEDSSINHSGSFKGIMTLWCYMDKYDIIHYDKIQWYSDRYANNQYIGTWTGYKNEGIKICNWGEYRIPFSNELDIGAGHFSPDRKYFRMGWDDIERK